MKNSNIITLIVTILMVILLTWDYFNGGVPVHYILANDNLPGLSNWWGLITVPILTWILSSMIFKRIEENPQNNSKAKVGFLTSIAFGILLSVLWNLDLGYILQYLILLPVALSLFVKVHKPECLLGFVLGMVFTFGGVLPIGFGIVLLFLSFLTYVIVNRGIYFLLKKKEIK